LKNGLIAGRESTTIIAKLPNQGIIHDPTLIHVQSCSVYEKLIAVERSLLENGVIAGRYVYSKSSLVRRVI